MNEVEKNKGGRPTLYTDELAKDICLQIATTSKGIKTLCRENPHWPSHETIFVWIFENDQFSDLYNKAKRQQVTAITDECLDIADDSGFDADINEHGKVVCKSDAINRARLRVDTRKWLAAKLAPKMWGDKSVLDESIDLISKLRDKLNEKQ